MSNVYYGVYLYNPDGSVFLADLSGFSSLTYTRTVNSVGRLELVIDSRIIPRFIFEQNGQVKRDQRIVLFRKPLDAPLAIPDETCWFVRSVKRDRTAKHDTFTVIAVDAMHLLTRRVVAYPVSNTETRKTAPIDDMIKQIVRENFVSATDTTRNMSGFTVDTNYSLCPSTTKDMARRVVMDLLRELADECAAPILTGYRFLFFDIVPTSTGFTFRTYVDQRGNDIRQQFRLGTEYNNLDQCTIEYTALDEVTRQYAGGEGQKNDRFIVSADNIAAQMTSPYNIIERFEDATNGETQAAVQAEARNKLNERRARIHFNAIILDTPASRYGLDYGFGDRLHAQAFGQTFDCRVNTVTISKTPQGETVNAGLVSEQFV